MFGLLKLFLSKLVEKVFIIVVLVVYCSSVFVIGIE